MDAQQQERNWVEIVRGLAELGPAPRQPLAKRIRNAIHALNTIVLALLIIATSAGLTAGLGYAARLGWRLGA